MKKTAFVLVMIAVLYVFSFASCESLVVYFSCTGTTKDVASMVADAAGADLYRLLPSVPYTEADLAYYTDCRADREQKDDAARPAISNMPTGLDKYDTIYLGYPIWHGQAPKIMYTFLENASLSGKKIVPFCTSHSSGVGTSAENLKKADGGSNTWTSGKRFSKDTGTGDVAEWLLEAGAVRICIKVGDQEKTAVLENNSSAAAFYGLLDLSVPMKDYGKFEKVGPLESKIVQNDTKITTVPGDLILYQGDKVTVYYAENTYTFTKLGHIEGATEENMKDFLGAGDPTVSFVKMKGNELASVTNCSSHTLEYHEGLEATCEQGGTEAYWSCSVCGKLFSDENGENEISEPISTEQSGHDWDGGKITKEATYSADGVKIFTCKRCGETKEETVSIRPYAGKTGWVHNADDSWSCGDEDGYALTGLQTIDGTNYFFDEKGVMATGWAEADGKWYYADASGALVRSAWKKVGGDWYYFRADGEMATGWLKDGGEWYYLKDSGRMATGWVEDGSDWYYFRDNGVMLTGWVQSGGNWYYMKSGGAMATGWLKDGGAWYYFNGSGKMVTGWQRIGGKWYCFRSSGAMITGWFEDKEAEKQLPAGEKRALWYWFDESGVMATGWKEIKGQWEMFDDSGLWLYTWDGN